MILSGVVASSAGGLVATGGNITFDANGYRHHYFSSSGTLNVSGPGAVKVIAQHGGGSGASWSSPSFGTVFSGAGGSSGLTQYYDATVTGNVTVTVGAAASTSGTGGAITAGAVTQLAARSGGTPWRAVHSGTFCSSFCCDGGGCYCCGYGRFWSINQTATNGTSAAEHSTISTVYSGVFQQFDFAISGGGGGAAGALAYYGTNSSYQNALASNAGTLGGGQGGFSGNNGEAAQANRGGGGGGGQGFAWDNGAAGGTSGGAGGSGYVIISYAI